MSFRPLRRIFRWVLFWIFSPPLLVLGQSSNSATVRGVVVDDSSKAPLQYVNVLLLRKGDSTLVTGSVTEPREYSEPAAALRRIPPGYRARPADPPAGFAFEVHANAGVAFGGEQTS